MNQLIILVEGQSEEKFVKNLLSLYLAKYNIHVVPNLIWTKRLASGSGYRGGSTSWEQIKLNINNLLRSSHIYVTTILDYYALSEDVPGFAESRKIQNRQESVKLLESAVSDFFKSDRLIPFFSLHEFEAWVFAQPEVVVAHFGEDRKLPTLQKILRECGSPEAINHGKDTHPKARLATIFPQYKESSDGPQILSKMGIDQIRSQCPHFHDWLNTIVLRCGVLS